MANKNEKKKIMFMNLKGKQTISADKGCVIPFHNGEKIVHLGEKPMPVVMEKIPYESKIELEKAAKEGSLKLS